jgi:hypothetical protein
MGEQKYSKPRHKDDFRKTLHNYRGNYHFITESPKPYPTGCAKWGRPEPYPTFYEGFCLGGNKKVISVDTPDLGTGFAGSIEIPSNYVITIYESTNYQGKARTLYFKTLFPEEFYGGSAKIRKLSPLEIHYSEDVKNIISPADIDEILNAHNKYRMQVGINPLVWDEQEAASAKEYANTLAKNNAGLVHSRPGQNLGQGYNTWTDFIDVGTYSLASEKKCFKNGVFPDIYNGQCNANPNCASYQDWRCAGHYSQIVWRDTQKVGAGRTGNYWVLHYSPPGNINGQKAY